MINRIQLHIVHYGSVIGHRHIIHNMLPKRKYTFLLNTNAHTNRDDEIIYE